MGFDANALAQLLREHGASYRQNTKSYIFHCPRCGKKDKLYMSRTSGRFVCFVCRETDNYQGRPEYALTDILGISISEIQGRLYGGQIQARVYLEVHLEDFFGYGDEVDEDADVVPEVSWPLDYYPIDHVASAKGATYLEGRGIPLALARKYGIRYAPEEQRVVFPIESRGRLYGWQRRLVVPGTWTDEKGNLREAPKILSSTGIPRDRTLMFVDRLEGSEHAVLCEGPVDSLKSHICGGNVCAMGKAVSRGQINLLLLGGVKKIYLGLDPDAAEETKRLVADLWDHAELYEMVPKTSGPGKVDLGALTPEEVYDLFVNAPRVQAGRLFVFLDPRLANPAG